MSTKFRGRGLDLALLLLLVAVAARLCWTPAPSPAQRLVGCWLTDRNSREVQFGSDSKVVSLDTKAKPPQVLKSGTYQIHCEKVPWEMEILQQDRQRDSHAIFEFTPQGDLRVEEWHEGQPRPASFSKQAIVLQRK